MRALVVTGPGALSLQDVTRPSREGECLIRVRAAGICGTDLQILEGYAGFAGVPGHEFVGVVESAPPADAAWIGKRVVGEINVGCGACAWCDRREEGHCPNRNVLGIRHRDGAFADFVTLPARNLHAVPHSVDDETAVFAEPVAAACRVLEQMSITPGQRVAVVGDGRMGLIVAQVIKTVTSLVTVFGRHAPKLATARGLGLTTSASSGRPEPADRFDIVIDVTGRPEGFHRALDLVRPRGTVVLKSTFHGEARLESWPIVVNEVTLLGSRCGPFKPAIELLASGAVRVKPLISRIATLEDHGPAFADARRSLKVLFAM